PSLPTLRGVTAGENRLIAVGDAGTILSSTNGVEWVRENSGVTNRLNSVAYDRGEFVIVGHEGRALRSTDGKTWIRGSLGSGIYARAVASRDGVTVACGENGALRVRNPAGVWEVRKSGTETHLNGIARSPGATVVVGDDGEILRSTNLIDWVRVESGLFQSLLGVRYLDEAFLAVGEYGTVVRSQDGQEWTLASEEFLPEYRDVTTVGNLTVVVGQPDWGDSALGQIVVSESGTEWSDVHANLGPLYSVTRFGNQKVVAVGAGGLIAHSVDGFTWEAIRGTATAPLGSLTQTPGGWWLASYSDWGQCTTDRWRLKRNYPVVFHQVGEGPLQVMAPSATPDIVHATELHGRWVAVGTGSNTWVSDDGKSWTPGGAIPGAILRNLAVGDGRFVAVGQLGNSGLVASSTEGLHWQVEALHEGGALNHVVFGNGRFVAAGDHGARLTSAHGGPWVPSGTPWAYAVSGLAYGNGRFVAVLDYLVYHSRDGLDWRKPAQALEGAPYAVGFGGGRFLAAGLGNTLAFSVDADTWTSFRPPGPTTAWYCVAWVGAQFLLAGQDGTLAWSGTNVVRSPTWLNTPRDVRAIAGYPVTLDAAVVESAPTTYQWYKDNAPIPGATACRLDLPRAGPDLAGTYWLLASNRLGSLQSDPVALTVSTERPADRWEILRNPTTSLLLDRCASSPERFVATTADGGLALSTNGYEWSALPSLTTNRLTQIRYLQDRFLVLGEGGFVAVSPDGSTWTRLAVPTKATLRDVVSGDHRWVIVGDEATILTSADLATWLTRRTPVSTRLMGVCWTGTDFYAAGDFGVILSSAKGETWTEEDTQRSVHFTAIAAGNDTVVVVGEHGAHGVRAPSGWWFPGESQIYPWERDLRDIAWWDGQFYVAGLEGAGIVHTSNAGSGASQSISGTRNPRMLSAICAGPQGIFGVAGTALMRPERSTPWSAIAGEGHSTLLDIAPVAGRLVAVGDHGTILLSDTGTEWRTVPSGTTNVLTGVAGLGHSGVIVGMRDRLRLGGYYGRGGILLYSPDGLDWAEIPNPTTNKLRSVCTSATRYVVGGDLGTLLVSENGREWSQVPPFTSESVCSLIHDGRRFWGTGFTMFLTSEDGLHWTTNRLSAWEPIDPVVGPEGGLTFLGRGQLWHWQTDGTHGIMSNSLPFYPTSLAGLGPTLAATSDGPRIALSRDGSEWSIQDVGQGWNLFRVRSIAGALYAVGQYGVVLRSGPEARLTLQRSNAPGTQLQLRDTGGRPFRVQRRDHLSNDGSWQDLGPGTPTEDGSVWNLPDPAVTPETETYFRAILDTP
ncbi:MAG: hypothetical protein IT580_17995, partial [Verrucomicrobiales bacterium]|nr:hypothetical protein [Verrucomicrobiales bacterium]